MTELTLRPWRPSDLEPCMEIWRAASEIGHPFLRPADLDADADLVRTIYMPATDITVAAQGGEIAGFIARAGDLIGALFVAPARHRQGVGTRLLDHVASDHAPLDVEVYAANRAAHQFYANAGFAEVLRRPADDRGRPYPLIRMRLGPPVRPERP